MNNFGKNIAVWVIISLVLIAIFNVFQGNSSKSSNNAIAYSDFLARVNSGEVREVSREIKFLVHLIVAFHFIHLFQKKMN